MHTCAHCTCPGCSLHVAQRQALCLAVMEARVGVEQVHEQLRRAAWQCHLHQNRLQRATVACFILVSCLLWLLCERVPVRFSDCSILTRGSSSLALRRQDICCADRPLDSSVTALLPLLPSMLLRVGMCPCAAWSKRHSKRSTCCKHNSGENSCSWHRHHRWAC